MNFDDIKASFAEQFEDLKSKITESALYNTAKEQFQALTPNAQKGIIWGGCALVILIMIYIPYGSISKSFDYEAEFDEKRTAIKELFKYGTTPAGQAPLPSENNTESIVSSVRTKLSSFELLSEQIGFIQVSRKPAKNLAKPPIVQDDVTAQLKWLNLTQITDIAYTLQRLGKNIKLTGVDIKAAPEADKKNYFNVKYTLSSFSFPQKDSPNSKAKDRK